MNLVIFLLPYLFTGLAVSLVSVLIERLIIHIGLTPGNTILTAVFAFTQTVLFQLLKFPQPISFDWLLLSGLFIGLMVAYRYDLNTTVKKGRWWWKSQNNEQK